MERLTEATKLGKIVWSDYAEALAENDPCIIGQLVREILYAAEERGLRVDQIKTLILERATDV